MPRQLAGRRAIAIGRQPIPFPRKVVGFQNDNKLHVVLDTNILIYALEAKFKGASATNIEKDCLLIVEVWENGFFSVGINHYIFSEYTRVANRKVKEGKVSTNDVSHILDLAQKSAPFRVMVDQRKVSRHQNDDILFDGVSGDYLVSENWKDVRPDRLKSQSGYKNIIRPHDFILELRKLRIIT